MVFLFNIMEETNLFFDNKSFGDGSASMGHDMGDKLFEAIQTILDARFPNNPQKREIKNMSNGYKIACPYCGDSSHDDTKKRGVVHLSYNSFKCWNGGCDVYRPINSFLTDNHVEGFTMTEMNSLSVQHVISNSSNKKSLADFYDKDIMFDKDLIINKLKGKSIEKSVKGFKYLESRNAHAVDLSDMAYNDYFGNLIFLNMFEDKVLGVQVRLKEAYNGSRFMSYNYNDIQEKLIKSDDYDREFAKSINRVSLIYNILNVNFQSKVNIFESTLDSKYFPNSIAIWGASNELKIPNGYYFFDNDVAGRLQALKYLESGHNVFLWSKFLKYFPRYRGSKDINDIYKINGRFNSNLVYDYFGNSKFDKLWL